jgi:hypothetical protein
MTLFGMPGDWALEYRALLLAGDRDVVALGIARNHEFERYCRELLCLGSPRVVEPAPGAPGDPVAARCLRDSGALEEFAALARQHGRLNIVPYIGTGNAWSLAARIASDSGAEIRVAAPLPRLTRRANDKLWFAARVSELLGSPSLPPSYGAYGAAALSGRVRALAKRHPRIAVKLPDSAGSAGNLVLDSTSLLELDVPDLRAKLLDLLGAHGWRGGFPLLVSVWECPVALSPSVQLWIPRADERGPIVEGIFEQRLHGEQAEFVGSVPADLPEQLEWRLATEGAQIGCLLQELGYYGRCSLDAVLVGEEIDSADIHWVECNARWGGTSIPMTLANRLIGNWRERPFVVVDRTGLELPRRPFAWLLERFGVELFRAADPIQGIILHVPGRIEEGQGFDFMALAPAQKDAQGEAEGLSAALLDRTDAP